MWQMANKLSLKTAIRVARKSRNKSQDMRQDSFDFNVTSCKFYSMIRLTKSRLQLFSVFISLVTLVSLRLEHTIVN